MHRSHAVIIVLILCVVVAVFTAVITYYVSEYYRVKGDLDAVQDGKSSSPSERSRGIDHRVRYNHAPGPCRELKGAGLGSEDVSILPSGLTFISTGYFRNGDAGGIATIDLSNNAHNYTVKMLPISGYDDLTNFHPHGIATWTNPDTGLITITAVNHPSTGDVVEVFLYNPLTQSLNYTGSITAPLFNEYSLNDLVMLDEEQFYITGFSKAKTIAGILDEISTGKTTAGVLFFDGTVAREVATELGQANGICLSSNKELLYVAEFQLGNVLVYSRDQSTNNLKKMQSKNFDTGVDNIEMDFENGDLWIGGNPSLFDAFNLETEIMKGRTFVSPSQVLRLTLGSDGLIKDVFEEYIDPGMQLSGSTVASYFGGQMIIGSVSERILLCETRDCDGN